MTTKAMGVLYATMLAGMSASNKIIEAHTPKKTAEPAQKVKDQAKVDSGIKYVHSKGAPKVMPQAVVPNSGTPGRSSRR